MNKLQWNFNRNYNIFIQENAFESIVCEMGAILSRTQCVDVICLEQSYSCLTHYAFHLRITFGGDYSNSISKTYKTTCLTYWVTNLVSDNRIMTKHCSKCGNLYKFLSEGGVTVFLFQLSGTDLDIELSVVHQIVPRYLPHDDQLVVSTRDIIGQHTGRTKGSIWRKVTNRLQNVKKLR